MGPRPGVSLCPVLWVPALVLPIAGGCRSLGWFCWLSPRLTDCQSFLHIPIL